MISEKKRERQEKWLARREFAIAKQREGKEVKTLRRLAHEEKEQKTWWAMIRSPPSASERRPARFEIHHSQGPTRYLRQR